MQKPVLFSVSFHVLLVGAMWITIPDFFDDKEIKDKPIIVEIVSVDKDITSLESKRKNYFGSRAHRPKAKKEYRLKKYSKAKKAQEEDSGDDTLVVLPRINLLKCPGVLIKYFDVKTRQN